MTILSLFFVGRLAAGLYPAFMVSSFEPVKALKGKFHNTHKSTSFWNLRNALVIFQFTVSISLVASSIVVYKQLSFMKRSALGISIDNTLVVNTQATFGPPGSDSLFMKSLTLLKDKLDAYSRIEGVTASHDIPGKEHQ